MGKRKREMHKSAVLGKGRFLYYNVGGEGFRADREDGQGSASGSGGDLHDVQPHYAARLQDPRDPLANGGLSPVAPRTAVAAVVMPSSLLGFFLRLVGDWMWCEGNTTEVSYLAGLIVLPTAGPLMTGTGHRTRLLK